MNGTRFAGLFLGLIFLLSQVMIRPPRTILPAAIGIGAPAPIPDLPDPVSLLDVLLAFLSR